MSFFSQRKKNSDRVCCCAVIVAAGSSQRMGTDKTMLELGGMPVLARTVRAFQLTACVDEIIVVTRTEKIEAVAAMCASYGFDKVSKVICGGNTRMESALAGVCEVKSDAKLIAIHDGARPLVTSDVILRAVLAADKFISAVPVVRCTDTLKSVDDKGVVVSAVDRESTIRVQTPQVFDADIIKGALTNAVAKKLTLTDDCSAVELMGIHTHTVTGDEENIKLTAPQDIVIAEAILKGRGVA